MGKAESGSKNDTEDLGKKGEDGWTRVVQQLVYLIRRKEGKCDKMDYR